MYSNRRRQAVPEIRGDAAYARLCVARVRLCAGADGRSPFRYSFCSARRRDPTGSTLRSMSYLLSDVAARARIYSCPPTPSAKFFARLAAKETSRSPGRRYVIPGRAKVIYLAGSVARLSCYSAS